MSARSSSKSGRRKIRKKIKNAPSLRTQLSGLSSSDDEVSFVKGRVNTTIRIRPIINTSEPETGIVNITSNNVVVMDRNRKELTYSADNVLGDSTTQEEVFRVAAKPIISDIVRGYNGTILAYGQSGSGKTFTIMGQSVREMAKNTTLTRKGEGIIPRAIRALFKFAKDNPKEKIKIKLSLVQIYKEKIQDLLSKTPTATLDLREDPKIGFYVENLTTHEMSNYQCFMERLDYGLSRRATSSTQMNLVSSRSHAIMIVDLTRDIESGKIGEKGVQLRSKFYCVDLAGSENAKRAATTANRLNEGHYINLSLNALGNVIAALSKKHSFIPYRNSNLTKLLQNSLGGNCKTSLICNVCMEKTRISETINTMVFAERAIKIKMLATVNKSIDYKELCKQLQAKVTKQQKLIDELKQRLVGFGDSSVVEVVSQAEEKYNTIIETLIQDDIYEGLKEQIEQLTKIIEQQSVSNLPMDWDLEMEELSKELCNDDLLELEHQLSDKEPEKIEKASTHRRNSSTLATITKEDFRTTASHSQCEDGGFASSQELKNQTEKKLEAGVSNEVKKVLVVEDNMFSRKMMEAMIKSFGYEVESAPDGKVATDLVKKHLFSLIITDICMPEMDGYALVDQIKLGESLNKATPIIACSALESKEECMSQGLDGFVEKPITMEGLQEEIIRVLS